MSKPPLDEIERKRLASAREKFAENAAPLEVEMWDECSVEFGHKWLCCSLEIREALVNARIASGRQPICSRCAANILPAGAR